MAPDRLHPDEVDADAELAARLVAEQFPQWADLPVRAVDPLGTDRRLGEHLSVRLPRIERTRVQIDAEATWLPQLAPLLPVTIPVPVALGEPAQGFSWRWAVYPWAAGPHGRARAPDRTPTAWPEPLVSWSGPSARSTCPAGPKPAPPTPVGASRSQSGRR